MNISQITFAGWNDCHRITNGLIELIVVNDIGPRILSLRLAGGDNLLFVREEFAGTTGGDEWRNFGGHRLWLAPEDKFRSYQPDNAPGEIIRQGDSLLLRSPEETAIGIRKSILVSVDPNAPRVRLTHRLENIGPWDVNIAAWALTVMAPGGIGICPLPQESHPDGLLPNRPLALWPYSNFSDGRYLIGKDVVMLRQQSGFDEAVMKAKIGVACTSGWCAYSHPAGLLVKSFPHSPGATYPDFGCSVEMFTNNRMLELETLSPIQNVPPGGSISHEEVWEIFPQHVPVPDESSVLGHPQLGKVLRPAL